MEKFPGKLKIQNLISKIMAEKNFITRDEILKHRTVDSMWLVIDSKVYVKASN